VDFEALYSPITQLGATAASGFANYGESLFEAVQHTPADFFGKACGLACAKPQHNLLKFILQDQGFFDSRDEATEQLGSFQLTLRGWLFERFFRGRKSS
jgi:hypothetical protein